MAAGMKDVASLAGVAVGTVSNVLNHPNLVRPLTRARVEAAMEQLGFIPNGSARQLRAGRSRCLGLVVLDVTNPFFTEVARGVEDYAQAAGYAVIRPGKGRAPRRTAITRTTLGPPVFRPPFFTVSGSQDAAHIAAEGAPASQPWRALRSVPSRTFGLGLRHLPSAAWRRWVSSSGSSSRKLPGSWSRTGGHSRRGESFRRSGRSLRTSFSVRDCVPQWRGTSLPQGLSPWRTMRMRARGRSGRGPRLACRDRCRRLRGAGRALLPWAVRSL